jgi:hypothetical protein
MTRYVQKGKYESTELDGEWIILNTDDYTITKLNEVGGICWSLLNEVQTVDTLSESLLVNFTGGNVEQVKNDIQEFLVNLVQCGLISKC